LIETDHTRFLVDCGMFHGGAEAAMRNHRPFPFRPSEIDFVLLTHSTTRLDSASRTATAFPLNSPHVQS
jgi:Cft2 family RNA processing exonuclease